MKKIPLKPQGLVKKRGKNTLFIEFEDNNRALAVFGELNGHLFQIESALNVRIDQFGNRLEIFGETEDLRKTEALLEELHRKTENHRIMQSSEITDALRYISAGADLQTEQGPCFKTGKGIIKPRSPAQTEYAKALRENDLVVGTGPAGTGKTFMAVAAGVDKLLGGAVERIIITRPAVEAGEKLGFLPGDMKEKVDPYLRPIFDALGDMIHPDKLTKLMEKHIEIAPLAFMRGRTLSKSFVILDEAQNTTVTQMKMFLTRLGDNSTMAVNGDPNQIDLPRGVKSGLVDFLEIIDKVPGAACVRFSDNDVMRHPLVARIIKAYDERDAS